MARLSHDEYKQIIALFNWNNLNKEITGNTLRQFINNILDSVAEMKLLNGDSIEDAIQKLKNRPGGGGDGLTVDFSTQFQIINDTVWMNLSLITAMQEEPEVEPDPPAAPNDFDLLINPNLNNFLQVGSVADLALSYNTEHNAYVLSFLNPVTFIASNGFGISPPFLLFNLIKLGYANLQFENGDYLRAAASIGFNDLFLNAVRGYPYIYGAGINFNPSTGGYGMSASYNQAQSSWNSWQSISFRSDWRFSLFDEIRIICEIFDGTTIPAGSEVRIKNINLMRF